MRRSFLFRPLILIGALAAALLLGLTPAGAEPPAKISTEGQACLGCHEPMNPGITAPVLARDEHRWKQGLTPDKVQEILEFYKKRYGQ